MVPPVLTTARLRVRPLTLEDAPFIVTLLNDAGFIRHIGDRGVRTTDDARLYLTAGPLESYARHGFGLCAVDLVAHGRTIGICGLLKRDELPAPDIGFAFLPQYRSFGYAYEAAVAVRDDAFARIGIDPLLAIVNPDNGASIRLLERLGFAYDHTVRLSGERKDLHLFVAHAPQPAAL